MKIDTDAADAGAAAATAASAACIYYEVLGGRFSLISGLVSPGARSILDGFGVILLIS